MFKNALVLQWQDGPAPDLSHLEAALQRNRFVPCSASQPLSCGWVPPRGQKNGQDLGGLVESIGGHWILKLAEERKSVPASAVNDALEQELQQFEARSGRRPRGKAVRDLKEQIVHRLLPRAFPRLGFIWVWINRADRLVVLDAGSLKKADTVLSLLGEALGPAVRLAPLQTRLSAGTAMAQWLTSGEAPAGFTLDRDCELKQPDLERPTVRYTRHLLELPEVAEHIRQGKLPTQLGLTWASRVSFVLQDSGTLKKVALLDVVLEGQRDGGATPDGGGGRQQDPASDFDGNVALLTGELQLLLPALLEALGGLQEGAPAVPAEAGGSTADGAAGSGRQAGADASPAAAGSGRTAVEIAPWDDAPA